jgi:hypothetical protein
LLKERRIQEFIFIQYIDKISIILKRLIGSDIELITISVADILFLFHWYRITTEAFVKVHKPDWLVFFLNSKHLKMIVALLFLIFFLNKKNK